MMEIDTASALAKMNDTYDFDRGVEKTYGIRFVKDGGQFREIFNARKGVKHPQHQAKPNPNRRGKSHKKFSGTVQVYDADLKQFRDIFFDCIIAFRDYQSTQWQKTRLT